MRITDILKNKNPFLTVVGILYNYRNDSDTKKSNITRETVVTCVRFVQKIKKMVVDSKLVFTGFHTVFTRFSLSPYFAIKVQLFLYAKQC